MAATASRRAVPLLIGKLEAGVLLLVGAAALAFAVVGRYELLMNPRFRWLTVAGAVLLIALGLVLASSRQRGSALGAGAFLLLTAIVVVGKPYVPTVDSRLNVLPPLDIELPAEVDESRFQRAKLPSLFTAPQPPEHGVVTMGAVKRLPETDRRGGFLLMDSLMVCCAADMFGVGYYVPVENVEDYRDGELVVVCGRFVHASSPIEFDNFRFGNALVSIIDDRHELRPEMIFPYDREAAMPTLAELMDTGKMSVFRAALQATDLWRTLEGGGEYTVFAPVDEAFSGGAGRWPSADDEGRRRILADHIVTERLLARDLYDRQELLAVGGATIRVEVVNGKLIIGGARVLLQDKVARNGVLHYVYPLVTTVER